MRSFFSGLLGGGVIIAIAIIIFLFSSNLFLYNIHVINPSRSNDLSIYDDKIQLLKEMERDGVLLTPQEYTNNITSYYNTAITLLVTLFILFSFISYFHLKFLTKEQLIKSLEEKIKDSKEMEELIMSAFVGKADDKYAPIDDFDRLKCRFDDLENKYQEDFDEMEEAQIGKTLIKE